MFYHPTWNVKIGLSRRGRFSLTLFMTLFTKLSRLKKSWSFSKASLGSFSSIGIFHSGTSRSSPRLEPDFAFGGMSIAAITQAIASIPTNSPFVSFFLFIFFKFYWFIDGDRIVICSFFSRRKAEKVWWNRAVWWGGEVRGLCSKNAPREAKGILILCEVFCSFPSRFARIANDWRGFRLERCNNFEFYRA